MQPRVRFAPSPTGYLHIGGARTALFNWLYARRNNGVFVLRIEDTDQERSTPESLKAILEGLKWIGLAWDEGPEVGGKFGPYFQTERLASYKRIADELIAQGKAYRCYCSREELDARRKAFGEGYKYERTCRDRKDQPDKPWVLRFAMPLADGAVSFTDEVLGKISKTHADLDDFVLMRGDGIPLYNFGCVVDDHEMAITLVGRGQEHVNSTFPQLMIYAALGWQPPQFAHFPLILGADKEKLSKRKHPEADLMFHAKNGILPEALVNFILRIGWGHGNDEVIPREKMLEWFDFAHVGTTSGVWNPQKLTWLNQQYFKLLPIEVIAERLFPFLDQQGYSMAKGDPLLLKLVKALRERAETLVELAQKSAVYLRKGVAIDPGAQAKVLTDEGKRVLGIANEMLREVTDWSPPTLEALVKTASEKTGVGMGKIAQPIRVAVTGNTASPGIGDTLELLGKEESLSRIAAALK
jgi:glutamyl-tRNA synthetase